VKRIGKELYYIKRAFPAVYYVLNMPTPINMHQDDSTTELFNLVRDKIKRGFARMKELEKDYEGNQLLLDLEERRMIRLLGIEAHLIYN